MTSYVGTERERSRASDREREREKQATARDAYGQLNIDTQNYRTK